MQVGPYELTDKLGAGGMAEVWMARRASVGGASRTFAVKRLARHLADKPDYRAMFLDEARLSMLLSNSNIVQVFDAGEDQGEVYLAMEWVDGMDLAELGERLRDAGERLSTVATAFVIAELLSALAYAHDLRDESGAKVTVVHRDVSPQNVMLSVSGEVKLMDFGIARLQSEETAGTHIKGKVRYMPPEQMRGDSRAPTIDLFAVGAILHELLDGERFRSTASDDARLYGMVLDGEVPDPKHPDEIPPALEVLRQCLLADDADDRIATAREALELLYGWSGFRNAKLEIAELVKRFRGVEAPMTGGTAVITSPGIGGLEAGTELLPGLGEDPDASQTKLLVGYGGKQLADNPATERRAKAGANELDDTEQTEREGETTRRRKPEPLEVRKPTGRRALGLGLLGVLTIGGATYGTGSMLGWFESDPIDGPETPSDPPVDQTRHARVLGDSYTGYAGFRHPDMLALDKLGFAYAYVDEPDQAKRLAALGEGQAEFALTSLDRVLLDRPAGKIVAIVDLSMGSDALVLDTVHHPELLGLADIPAMLEHGDKPVLAYAAGTPSEYLSLYLDDMFAALDRDDLVISDQFADVTEVWQALEAEDSPIALGILWEPWVSKARNAGMTVAVSTQDLPHTIVDVLVASDAVLERDPELVNAVVLAYYRQAIAQHRNPRQLRDQLVRETGLEAEDVTMMIDSLCMLSPLGAEPWLRAQPAPPDGEARPALLDNAIHHAWATLALHGRVQGKLGETQDYYDARAVTAAAADTRALLSDSGIGALGIESTCLEAMAVAGSDGAQLDVELGALELPRVAIVEQPWFVDKSPELALEADGVLGEVLDRVAFELAEFNPATIVVRVVGFGDTRAWGGRQLGAKRAEVIAGSLRERGVSVRLEVEGRDVSDAPDRRIELELTRRR